MKHFIFALLVLSAISCSKSDDNDTQPIEPPVTQVTSISLVNGSSTSDFNQIGISYKTNGINTFQTNATGNVRISFRGLNGRSILGEYKGTTNLANFKIQNGDTIRIIKDGVKTDYITDVWDGINGGIYFESNSSETGTQAATRFNNYVNNVMPTQVFKGIY